MAQPVIDGDELNTRHNEFLRQTMRAITGSTTRAETERVFKEAQQSYAEWFAERGVTLVFWD